MNVLYSEKKLAVLSALVEGCSIRSTSRMTGVHKKTILKLLVEVGSQCATMLDQQIRNLTCTAIECDEIWTFVSKKERQLTDEDRMLHPDYGDQYTFVAFDPATKLVPSFVVGKRDGDTTIQFMQDLRSRLKGRIQISTDGFSPYINAIERVFGMDADYAQSSKSMKLGSQGWGATVLHTVRRW